jgi:hypothetical protein
MKSLKEFKEEPTSLDEEKSDYTKFDMLVRAGLANKSQLARLHRILDKMKEERPVFNPTDRAILQNLFNKMVGIITDNKQIFQRTRQHVREETEELDESIIDSATYKLSPSGRKVRTHRIKVGDEVYGKEKEEKDDIKTVKEETIQLEEQNLRSDPPFVLVLKRRSIRMYPDGMKIALYYNDKLGKFFSVPYSIGKNVDAPIQVESFVEQNSHVMESVLQVAETGNPQIVRLQNGTKQYIDEETATTVKSLYESLNEVNQNKMVRLIGESAEQFSKVVSFAFSKVK